MKPGPLAASLLAALIASAPQPAAASASRSGASAAALTLASRSVTLRSLQASTETVPLREDDGPSSLGPREAHVEALLSLEGEALGAQQQALKVLVLQQAQLQRQAEELQVEERGLTADIAAGGDEPRFNALFGLAGVTVRSWLITASTYLLLMGVAATLYGQFLTYAYDGAQNRNEDGQFKGEFSFGLFDGLRCRPDWRICCCSCFCLPIRWADTMSSRKVRYMEFWPALVAMVVLQTLVSVTFGIAGLMLVMMLVNGRQRIREIYGLPYGTWSTQCSDCWVWICCAPCAAMQEAMEIELMEPQQFKPDFEQETLPYVPTPQMSRGRGRGREVPPPPKVPPIEGWSGLTQNMVPIVPNSSNLDPSDRFGPALREVA